MMTLSAFANAPRDRSERANPIERALVLLAVMAALMLGGVGGPLAMLSAVSIIGVPRAALMFLSVPLMAFVLPARVAYRVLRRPLPRVLASQSRCVSAAWKW